MQIRFINLNDAESVLGIYAPYILKTAITFETVIPTVAEFAERIQLYTQKYPWLVAVEDGQLIGYAYASKHRDRDAYQWSVESSVYLHDEFQGRGIAKSLYDTLFDLLKTAGFVNVYAGITQPNEASNKLHQRMGFAHVGIYHNVGFKLGRWHDVLWMEKTLREHGSEPPEISSYR